MTEVLTTIATVLGAGGLYKLIEFIFSKRSRSADAINKEIENEKKEIENEGTEVERLEKRLELRDTKIDALYIELRKKEDEILRLSKENIELKFFKCDKINCNDRNPPFLSNNNFITK